MESELKKLYEQFMKFKENNTDLNEQRNAAFEERCVMKTAEMSLGMPAHGLAPAQRFGNPSDDDFDLDPNRSLLEDGRAGAGTVSDKNKWEKFFDEKKNDDKSSWGGFAPPDTPHLSSWGGKAAPDPPTKS